MAVGSGLSAQIGVAQETTSGTPTTTGMRFLEFNSESLELSKTTVQGNGLHAGGLYSRNARRAYVTREVTGDIEINVPTKGLGLVIQHMIGSFGATATQIGTTGAYKQIHTPGTLQGKTMTIQKGVPQTDGTVVPFTYTGAKVSEWELSCEAGDIATLSLSLDAWDELTPTSTPAGPALATAVYLALASEFHFAQGAITLGGTVSTASGETTVTGGTQVAAVTKASVKQSNAMKTDRYFYGATGRKAEQIENDFRELTGTIEAEFANKAQLYDVFAADSGAAMHLTFTGPAIGSSTYLLDILVPVIHLDGESPKVDGPEVVALSCDWTGLDDGSNPPIQITLISTDTAI